MPIFKPSSQADETVLSLSPRTTDLSSEGLRFAWSDKIKDAALFSARTTKDSYLQMVRKYLGEVAAGTTTPQVAEAKLKQTLQNLGYTPEAGFPDNNGRVPPATPGSIRDLSSSRRIQLILDTNVKQARSLGQIAASQGPVNLFMTPAWKLTRTGARKKPRGDWKRRWKAAGDACGWQGAAKNVFVALKTSPIWKMLAKGAGNFNDTIGTDYPPFAFGSGMAWVGVSRREWIRICEAENIDSGDALRLEAARVSHKGEESLQKPPYKPLQEQPSIYTPESKERDRARIIKEIRQGTISPSLFVSQDTFVERKTSAQRGVIKTRKVIDDYETAILERYVPAAKLTIEKIKKYSEDRPLEIRSEVNAIRSALLQYKETIEKLQEVDRAMAKIQLAVSAIEPPDDVKEKQDLEIRFNRVIAASGRYENYAIEEFKKCKEANEKVKVALANFKSKLEVAGAGA